MTRKGLEIVTSAEFSSPINSHRYTLTRDWLGSDLLRTAPPSTCLFIMLNPSTADATKDDPTIRRCIDYAMLWGHSRLVVCNLFSYRSTYPQIMVDNGPASIGEANDSHILEQAKVAQRIIVAWGCHGKFLMRDVAVMTMLRDNGIFVHALKLNDDGTPVHPLRQRKDVVPALYLGRHSDVI